MSQPSQRPPGAPTLVVGNIEISGSEIRIGGVAMTSGQTASPPPASVYPPPEAAPPAMGSAQPGAFAQPAPARALSSGAPWTEAPPSARPAVERTALVPAPAQPPSVVDRPVSRSVEPLQMGLSPVPEARVGHPVRRTLGGMLWYGGIFTAVLWATVMITAGPPFRLMLGVSFLLSCAITAGHLLRRANPLPKAIERPVSVDQQLVLLADRLGGSLTTADVVKHLGLEFEQSETVLRTLAAKGHATIEFDPQTQGSRFRFR